MKLDSASMKSNEVLVRMLAAPITPADRHMVRAWGVRRRSVVPSREAHSSSAR